MYFTLLMFNDTYKLDASHKGFTYVPNYSSRKNITEIDLSYNEITVVHSSDFPDTIERINLSHNKILNFVGVFPKSLKRLNISNNKWDISNLLTTNHFPKGCTFICDDLASSTDSLSTIEILSDSKSAVNIRDTYIDLQKDINHDILYGPTDYVMKNYDAKSLIFEKTFPDMTNMYLFNVLEVLKIKNCPFNELNGAYLPSNLKELYIIDCLVKTVYNLPQSLEYLDLNKNSIVTFDGSYLSNVTELDLDDNKLKQISYPPFVKVVVISCNFLETIGDLPVSIEELYCQDNYIRDNNFDKFLKLKRLNIENNKVSGLFVFPPNIVRLNASDNDINSINNIPMSLTHLDVSENKLQSFPENPNYLKQLNCSNNDLFTIGFQSCLRLEELSISNNNKLINVYTYGLPFSLKYLDASHCNIKTFVNTSQYIEYINLSGNPLDIRLTINGCHKLKELDISHTDIIEIKELPINLGKINISGCDKLLWVNRYQQPFNLKIIDDSSSFYGANNDTDSTSSDDSIVQNYFDLFNDNISTRNTTTTYKYTSRRHVIV